ncbi:MAG: DUF2304 domain-containing protein [Mobiluncus porci]|uniref:DUF2304 domain-containing protein n=1 Tax=Mobiluncus porci TaxID=2652278 RepID=A0A7K0K3H6_9ACTO|nr:MULTISPECIES: DUF2304 domain-containing protein [Mobiluncus]MCI6584008.1 DUF2304 domain-containing protein [Mobiluncus sp.]MDD7542526.1 DUF2304 domain-containing protein [Mobiluncus porci]MDY5748823.1 DUF2304 domain-containing protein [Mobiluncus porci]MST50033.1 DUF2304 domain-containing protein [Mobiluncus porci]
MALVSGNVFGILVPVPAVSWAEASHLGIKIVLLLAVVFGLIYVSRLKGARNLAMRRILALLFAIGAAIAIIYPPVISAVARFLGVGRGTDLLLYALVVVVLATWLVQWRYNIAVQARLTELTRQVALANPEKPSED